jgi:hypothetical protein
MVLAAPGPLLTPPPSSFPPKTPFQSYSAQIRSQNEEKNQTPQVYFLANPLTICIACLVSPHFMYQNIDLWHPHRCQKPKPASSSLLLALLALTPDPAVRAHAGDPTVLAGAPDAVMLADHTRCWRPSQSSLHFTALWRLCWQMLAPRQSLQIFLRRWCSHLYTRLAEPVLCLCLPTSSIAACPPPPRPYAGGGVRSGTGPSYFSYH